MLKFKHRKLIFLVLLGLMAGSTMSVYSASEANFLIKTVTVVVLQQVATVVIFLGCFGVDLMRSR
jgi:uncharacterized membrane protein